MNPRESGPPRGHDYGPGEPALPTSWPELPEPVRRRVTAALGGEPSKIDLQPWIVHCELTGTIAYNDFVATLTADSGAALLVKAAGPARPHALRSYRREAGFYAALPPGVPAPELVFADDIDGWTVFGIDTAAPHPRIGPTPDADLRAFLDAWALAAEALNRAQASSLDPIRRSTERFDVLRDIASDQRPWLRRAMPNRLKGREVELAAIEPGIDDLFHTTAMTHGDLSLPDLHLGADRTRISGWGTLQFCPPWVDTVRLLSACRGGSEIRGRSEKAESLFWDHPTSEGVTGAQLDAFLAATAGVMLDLSQAFAGDRFVGNGSLGKLNNAAGWLADRRGW